MIDIKQNDISIKDIRKIAILESLKDATFEIGLFEYGHLKDKVTLYEIDNLDNSYEYEMELDDILYFVERGTLTSPPLHLLEHIKEEIIKDLRTRYLEWIKKGVEQNKTFEYISNILLIYNDYITNVIIPREIDKIAESQQFINNVLENDKSKIWLYDIKKLKKYLRSRLNFAQK